jgi:GT2 family glycosyltransferase
MEVIVANLHPMPPKIDFLKLQAHSMETGASMGIYLFTGSKVSPSELADCKRQLEALAPSTIRILDGHDESISVPSEFRKIGIVLEVAVTFEGNFLENLAFVFNKTDTFCSYSDFRYEDSSGVFVKKLPAWSPIRYQSLDYLGPVLTFDLSVYMDTNKSESVARQQIVEFAQSNGLRFSRVPIATYKSSLPLKQEKKTARNLSNAGAVSVVIPTQGIRSDDGSLLETCISGLSRQTGVPDLELIVVADEGYDKDLIFHLKEVIPTDFSFKLIEFNEPFNFSRKCNIGAAQASGEVIVFLNDDVELISSDAIAKLSGYAQLDGSGAVGSRLLFSDGSIQHAGIILHDSKPRNSYLDQFPRTTDFGDLEVPHEVSGVTGACLAIKHDAFNKAGGWNEELPNSYNDVDLCLRLNNMGFQSVLLNDLEIVHKESSTRNPEFDAKSFEILKRYWSDEMRSERYLRSVEANGEYQGPWGSHKGDRTSLEGRYIAYTIHLIRRHGVVVSFKQLFSRVSGKSKRILNVTRHEYL